MDKTKAIISITGKVQGVWFRAFTRNQANRFTISGWVKNVPDGSVYCEAQGSEENLRLFIHELHRGPEASSVSHVDVKMKQTFESFSGFEIRH